MSTPQPPRRRRIAGERRRPDGQSGNVPEAAAHTPAQPTSVEELHAPPPALPLPSPPPPEASSFESAGLSTRHATRPGRQKLWFAVSALLALALVVTACVLGLIVWNFRDVQRADAADKAGRNASAAAERAAVAILSYGYDRLDADLERATRFMTPKLTQQYSDTFESFVRPNAGKLRARVTAEVLATGVVNASESRAEILVYVDQTTLSTANGGDPSTALNRTAFLMVNESGSWLVDDIKSY